MDEQPATPSSSRWVSWQVATSVAGGILAVLVVIVFAAFAGAAVGLREAYLGEVRTQVAQLAVRGPRAAERIENRDDRVGRIAGNLELSDRMETLTRRLSDAVGTSADELQVAARSVPAYVLTFILAIFLLYSGPRLVEGGFGLLDEQRRARWQSATTRRSERSNCRWERGWHSRSSPARSRG